ncbi:alpha/beta hydrolase [Sediminibacterium sp.]|jgi:acetyl esterase/lipase|uniref:alpha/beta hydrolase n=1 Tax=Sediminibacterium sp. TaxID=1917865 RepID=UPI0025EBC175|nr:alpha/beta hydrolase [Sediminibacterium sp.]MBW0178494.1 alpha/beta hydrolase [Sediminibacterium sp.]
MKKVLLATLFFISFQTFTTAQTADTTIYKPVEYPEGYEAQIDVVYNRGKDWQVKHDIYFNPKAIKPTPVVFNIHGGGWNHGTKEGQSGFGSYFNIGLAVVNVEYRLTPQATAPAAVEDVRASILYIVKHAKELNIDPNKIIVMGSSAGGHLALMAGLLQNDNKFDGDYKDVNCYTIAAIIDKFGPTDLTVSGIDKNKSVIAWMGSHSNDRKFIESMSPIFYVKKTSPPVFIIHGDADPIVPYQQSVDLHKKFLEVGVKTEFITIKGGLHGKFDKENNSQIKKAIADFLKSLGLSKN